MVVPSSTSVAAATTQDLVQIDWICDQYEQALKARQQPSLSDALLEVPEHARSTLLGELLLIEAHHGKSFDAVVDEHRATHPELAHLLDAAISLIRDRVLTKSSSPAQTHISNFVLATESFQPPSKAIELVCPHCGSSLPIALDSKQDNVACPVCENTFNLSKDLNDGCGAATLKQLGHFRLTARLGVGGCGTVWKAHDTKLDRIVAIKIPRSGRFDGEDEERLFREARAVARLAHPNIVSVHEVGHDDSLSYIVSDFVHGEPLSDWLAGRIVSARQAAELLATVTEALHYAHEQGVVHRDIKPSNIMMDRDGQPRITDFGLAKMESAEFSIAVDRQVLGTPAYMSPEQARGEAHRCDRRTDIYSLGVVLFQLLAGELPFRGNAEMLLHQIKYDAPASPRKLNKNVPKDLETICLKCLEKPLGSRYQTARALANDVRRYLGGEPIHARPVSLLVRGLRWCQRKPAAAAALALLIFIAIAGPVSAFYQAGLRRQAETAQYKEGLRRREAQALVQALVGLRGSGSAAAGVPPSLQLAMPLVTNRLTTSAIENGLAILDGADANGTSDDATAKLYLAVGVLAARQGRTQTSIEHLERASELLQRLHEAAPTALRYAAASAFCHECLGQIYASLGETNISLQHHAEAVSKWRRLADEHPKQAEFRRSLAKSLLRLSLTQSLAGDGKGALENVKESKTLVDELADSWTDDPDQLYLRACELGDCPPVLDAT